MAIRSVVRTPGEGPAPGGYAKELPPCPDEGCNNEMAILQSLVKSCYKPPPQKKTNVSPRNKLSQPAQ